MTSNLEILGSNPSIPPDSETLLKQLQTAVAAKVAYWDAITVLEGGLSPFAEFTEYANDKLVDMVDDLCAGLDAPGDAFTKITTAELKAVERKLKDLLR